MSRLRSFYRAVSRSVFPILRAAVAASVLAFGAVQVAQAFPDVVSAATSENAADVTTHTVTLPSGLVAGNRLLIFATIDDDVVVDVNPSGFTKVAVEGTEGTTGNTLWLFEKRDITGSEGGSITFHTATAQTSVHRVYQVTGDKKTSAAEVTETQLGSSANPDSDPLSPSWGNKDTLWFIALSMTTDSHTVSVYPSGYTNTGLESNSVGGPGSVLAWGYRQNATGTEDPSAFTTSSGSSTSRMLLVGIEPADVGGGGGGGSITFVGVGTACAQDNATCVPTLHASTTAGDLAVCPTYYKVGNQQPVASGYANLLSQGSNNEFLVLGKIVTGSSDNPTITVSGGTGSSLLSQCVTYRGTLNTVTGIVAHATTQSNTSAQDILIPSLTIATPDTLVCAAGRKGDDWTSVAALSGLTERVDTSTTLGTDAGLVMDCVIQTTATNFTGTSFVVTGGSTSASASMVFSIKPAAAAAATLTDVNTTESFTATATNIVYTGTNLGATGVVTLEQGGTEKTLAEDSYTSTGGQVDISGVGMGVVGGLQYGLADFCVTTVTLAKVCLAVTISPPSGTAYFDMSGGLASLFWDDNGSPRRIYGDPPNDLQENSQVAIRNVVGCTLDMVDEGASDPRLEDDIWVRPTGTVLYSSACQSADHDFSRDGLYSGTTAVLLLHGLPPVWAGITLPDITYAQNVPIIPISLPDFFELREADAAAYLFKQLTTATALTTAVGDGDDLQVLTLASIAGIAKNDWLQIGSTYARVRHVDPFNVQVGLWNPATWLNGDTVSRMDVGDCDVQGLGINPSTFQFEGTPNNLETNALCFFRLEDTAGLIADSP